MGASLVTTAAVASQELLFLVPVLSRLTKLDVTLSHSADQTGAEHDCMPPEE